MLQTTTGIDSCPIVFVEAFYNEFLAWVTHNAENNMIKIKLAFHDFVKGFWLRNSREWCLAWNQIVEQYAHGPDVWWLASQF